MACATRFSQQTTFHIRWFLKRSYSTSQCLLMGRRGRLQTEPRSVLAEEEGVEVSAENSVFIDGEVREKRTLRREMERKGLSPNADPTKASTFAAIMRQKLQKKFESQKGDTVEEQEPSKSKGDI